METALFGLAGVIVGALLTTFREWWFKDKEQKKNGEYLAILITSMLERYVVGCVDVIADDGLYHGQADKDGYHTAQTTQPTFEPLSVQVEWKSLPANLMNEVLSFPLEIEASASKIDSVYEHVATPPDYDEYFEERQYQHARLGLRASKLASLLRAHASLPERPVRDWNPVEHLQAKLAELEDWRAERAKRHAETMEQLESSMHKL